MGFLSKLFGKKEDPINTVFENLNKTMWPGGEEQIRESNKMLKILTNNKIKEDQDFSAFMGAKALYYMNRDALHVSDYLNRRLRVSLTDEELKKVLVWLMFGSATPFPYIEKLLNNYGERETILAANGYGNLGTDLDEMPTGQGPFGSAKNPIPTRGIRGSNEYLAKLKLTNGQAITSNREGSLIVENIGYSIDCYAIFEKITGKLIGKIHICPYNKKDSIKVPSGFCLSDN